MAATGSSNNSTCFLPEEIWIEIFSYLKPNDILRARLVCKEWAYLSTFPKIKHKLRLKIDGMDSLFELSTYITERKTTYLPIHSLSLVKLEDNKDLEFILKSFAPQLRCLKLKDSIVFKTMAAANLVNTENLHFKFYETSPKRFGNVEIQFIKNYQNLSSVNIMCPDEIIPFGNNVLTQLLESHRISSLKQLHLTYNFDNKETFLKILQKYARTLQELEVYFETQQNPCYPKNWFVVLSKLKNLQILRISGDCKLSVTTEFFKNLPANAPLRLIELDGLTSLTDDVLKSITDKWMNTIRHLSIFFSGGITKKGAIEIWKLRKNLESLRIGFCRTLGMKEVLTAVASDTNYTLRQLCTYSMGCVNEQYLCDLARNLPNLEILDLSDNTQGLTNTVLAHIFRYQTNLRELYLDACCGFDDNGIAGLSAPELFGTYCITRLRKLEVLSMQNCKGLKGKFVDYLVFPNLHTLKLCKLKHINAVGFHKIVDNCPALEVLHIAYCDGLNDEALYYICDNLKLLLELNIEQCAGISNSAIDYAVHRTCIRYVTFRKNENCNIQKMILA